MESRTLVAYYSRTGSNRYLAERIASSLNADLEEIRPRLGAFWLMITLSAIGWSFGVRRMQRNPADYDRAILVGPIWVGSLITPLRGWLRRYRNQFKAIHFATCCGSSDEIKDDKFGYARVFGKVRTVGKGSIGECEAFPIPLVVPKELEGNDEAIMKIRLSDANFKGTIAERYDQFLSRIGKNEPVPA
jgi:hypothetical protein